MIDMRKATGGNRSGNRRKSRAMLELEELKIKEYEWIKKNYNFTTKEEYEKIREACSHLKYCLRGNNFCCNKRRKILEPFEKVKI